MFTYEEVECWREQFDLASIVVPTIDPAIGCFQIREAGWIGTKCVCACGKLIQSWLPGRHTTEPTRRTRYRVDPQHVKIESVPAAQHSAQSWGHDAAKGHSLSVDVAVVRSGLCERATAGVEQAARKDAFYGFNGWHQKSSTHGGQAA